MELEKAKIKGFPVADAADIRSFRERWPVGTRERLVLDLAFHTGAARPDLTWIRRQNIAGDLLVFDA